MQYCLIIDLFKNMNKITAYKVLAEAQIRKGMPARTWMDFSNKGFAYGCLPLIMANELGWDILCQASFRAIWNGDMGKNGIFIEYLETGNLNNQYITSHFGHGVLTFEPGFLFQTTSEHNLYVKGVPNYIKHGIQALEGLVETDWLPLPFTMNWKFTRPNAWVEFKKGEPIARILPYPRNYIENFMPAIKPISSNESLNSDLKIWGDDRAKHIEDKDNGLKVGMEKNYFKGVDKNGQKVDRHQKKITLMNFSDDNKPANLQDILSFLCRRQGII